MSPQRRPTSPDSRRPTRLKRRRRRLVVACAVALAVVAAGLLALDLHRRWPPSSADLAQMRQDAVVWQAALAPGWPAAYANDLTLPPAVARRIDARERSRLAGVETPQMLRDDLGQPGIAELMVQSRQLNAQQPREPVETLWQSQVVSLRFVRRDWHGAIVCDAMIWLGDHLAVWDAKTKRFVSPRLVDTESLYELVFRREAGRWRLASGDVLRYSLDASRRQFGPDTPHRLMPPGWTP